MVSINSLLLELKLICIIETIIDKIPYPEIRDRMILLRGMPFPTRAGLCFETVDSKGVLISPTA